MLDRAEEQAEEQASGGQLLEPTLAPFANLLAAAHEATRTAEAVQEVPGSAKAPVLCSGEAPLESPLPPFPLAPEWRRAQAAPPASRRVGRFSALAAGARASA